MKGTVTIGVVELRNYLLKPGVRDRFIEYFAAHFVAAQNALGGFVLGGFRIEREPDRFFWLRGFADMTARSRFLPAFYGGETWREHGPRANEMMLEFHRAHLVVPLRETIADDLRPVPSAPTIVDFYAAAPETIAAFGRELGGREANSGRTTFWRGETSVNDFPRLPVIQDENLLVAVTHGRRGNAPDEADWRRFLGAATGHERLKLAPAHEIYERNFNHDHENETQTIAEARQFRTRNDQSHS